MRRSDLGMCTQAKHWAHNANRQGIGHITKDSLGALAFEFETLVLLHVPYRSQRFELKHGCRTQF